MPGLIYGEGEWEGVEASGVYQGVVQEDMIATVRKTHRPFLDVYMKDLFSLETGYPLTYVPAFGMVLPLKTGQKVWVYFNHENFRYPVLWKLGDGLAGAYYSEVPEGMLAAAGDSVGMVGNDVLLKANNLSVDAKSPIVFKSPSANLFQVLSDFITMVSTATVTVASLGQPSPLVLNPAGLVKLQQDLAALLKAG
jgi:hypothetical protein